MKYAGMPMGMWVLMKELGLYDLTPALCRLDYTMSEAGAATNFVRQYAAQYWFRTGLFRAGTQ